jgi:putative transposase
MDWVRILAYITGTVDQELLLRNEYLAAENRILKTQLKTPLRFTDAERMALAERNGPRKLDRAVHGEFLLTRPRVVGRARGSAFASGNGGGPLACEDVGR